MYPREYYPAGGIFVHEQVKMLRRYGVEVVVLSGEPFWISRLNPRRVLPALRLYQNIPVQWSAWEDVPVVYFPYCVGGLFRNFVHTLTYWHGAQRVMSSIQERFPFDIIHAHTSFLDGLCAAKLGRLYKCPVVITEHMGPFSILTRNIMFRSLVRTAIRGADHVLAVSNALRRDMIAELGDCARRVEILGNGFDPEIFSYSPTPHRDCRIGKPVRMLWIGQVSPVKGLDRLIRALARAVARNPLLEITLLGGGKGIEEVLQLAAKVRIENHVHSLPSASREGVAAAIKTHDFVVISSHKETFSLVALEALACGRPVLTTACGGPEDFVVDGQNGLIVANNEEDLTDGLLKMASLFRSFDPYKIAAHVKETSTWERISERLVALYGHALAQHVHGNTATKLTSDAREVAP